jgi:hypothetical protein
MLLRTSMAGTSTICRWFSLLQASMYMPFPIATLITKLPDGKLGISWGKLLIEPLKTVISWDIHRVHNGVSEIYKKLYPFGLSQRRSIVRNATEPTRKRVDNDPGQTGPAQHVAPSKVAIWRST